MTPVAIGQLRVNYTCVSLRKTHGLIIVVADHGMDRHGFKIFSTLTAYAWESWNVRHRFINEPWLEQETEVA